MADYVSPNTRFDEIYKLIVELGKGNYPLRPASVGLGMISPIRRATLEECRQGKSSLTYVTPAGLEAYVKEHTIDEGIIDGYIDALAAALKEGTERIKKGS